MEQTTTPAFFPYRPAAVLRIGGADAANFLQGQFTNDLREVRNSSGVYGLWLNQKGRVLADSFIAQSGPEGFTVASYFSEAAVIQERLESYIIADDVVIENMTATWAAVSLLAANMGQLCSEFPPAAISFRGRRTG